MWGSNTDFVLLPALLAADPTPALDLKRLGPILPVAIGVVFTLGVLCVGLLLSRKKPTGIEEILAAQRLEPAPIAPNPLWRLILPGVAVLALGAAVVFVGMPLYQEVPDVGETFKSSIRSSYDEAMKSVTNPTDLDFPKSQLPEFKPIKLPPTPQINIPKYQPPPPPRFPTPNGGIPNPRR